MGSSCLVSDGIQTVALWQAASRARRSLEGVYLLALGASYFDVVLLSTHVKLCGSSNGLKDKRAVVRRKYCLKFRPLEPFIAKIFH